MCMYYVSVLLYSCENMFVFFLDLIVLFVSFLYTSGAFDPMIALTGVLKLAALCLQQKQQSEKELGA